jgi:lipoprotein NlpI
MSSPIAIAAALLALQAGNETTERMFKQAVADFFAGRVAESARGFDAVAARDPAAAPHLWQRGIALYYAGRYKDCREQFESHRKVNPNDVENAAWHYLCVARERNPDEARRALLPVGPDDRVPMREVYRMFEGRLAPQRVIERAGDDPEAQFYGHLYVGLYLEAQGRTTEAARHLTLAAEDRFRSGGYMHQVAKVHVALLQKKASLDD